MAEDIFEYITSLSPIFIKEIEGIAPRGKVPHGVYGLIWDFIDRGGKRFRPAMCWLACEAVGGDPKKIIPAGTAIEMFHQFTLIHDDIEDSSEMRRGKPTLHNIYGIPLAINAGDGLLMMVMEEIAMLKAPPEKVIYVEKKLAKAFRRVMEGQATELDWYLKKKWGVSESEFFEMVSGKTGALISASCEVGAYLGGANDEQISVLRDFGYAVGLAFQIQDDVLNLIGSEEKYKKEIGGDISEGKRSLITIHAMAHASPEDASRLKEILGANTKKQEEIHEAIAILKKYGSIDYAYKKAVQLVEDAKKKLLILPNNVASRRLLALADFFIYREV